MAKEIIIDQKVNEDLEKIKKLISQNPENAYTEILKLYSADTRNTSQQIEYLSAFEQAIGVFRNASLELRKEMDVLTLEQRLGARLRALEEIQQRKYTQKIEQVLTADPKGAKEIEELQKQITDARFFFNRYALFFAGNVGLALLNSEKADVKNQFTFGAMGDSSVDRDELALALAEAAKGNLNKTYKDNRKAGLPVTEDEIKNTLEAIFTSWINQFNWATFDDLAKQYSVDQLVVKYGNYSIKNGEFKRKYNTVVVDDKIMRVTKEDVIGAQDFGKILWDNMLKVAAYDFEKKKNPFDPAGTIFTYGAPGCGKTFTAHAYLQTFAELCRRKGIPLWILTHSVTDYASHYQNKTANELSALGEKIKNFQGIVMMYVADADTIFTSRKRELTAEQQNTMGVYFKMFDGTMVPKDGKFLAIMDANYIDEIDDATKSRLFDVLLELKRFEKAEDFAELARKTLTKGTDGGVSLPEEDWLAIGKYLLECPGSVPLNNREIGHILKQLRSVNVTEEDLGKSFEENVANRNAQLKGKLTRDNIIGKFKEYIDTRQEIERASYAKKHSEEVEQMFEMLNQVKDPTAQETAVAQ
ncbi:AAA family ATPase [Candidatus Woesearchaeota archaeon]|nr:AAA family ATPase [Candidatus Woesearchaeota archaeon]